MANWYYYSKTGEKVGPVSATSLKELARQGLITPETKVENQSGRTAVAGQINGLTFAETKQPETPPYGFGGGFDNGYSFPELTSEGQTSDGFDPFANSVPVAPQAVLPSKSPSPFTKPIVLGAIGLGCLFVLFILFGIIQAFRFDENGGAQRTRRNSSLSLKEPPPDADIIFGKLEKKLGMADAVKIPAEVMPIFADCLRVAEQVYEAGNTFKNEASLMEKMSKLQNSFDICMKTTEEYLSKSENMHSYPRPSATITYVQYGYLTSGCYHNLEEMMASIKTSVKKLAPTKYEHTVELYELLLQYEKAVTEPCESHFDYSRIRRIYEVEFMYAKDLAEDEW